MSRYYNPAGVANEVGVLQRPNDSRPWPGFIHRRLEVPAAADFEAWSATVTNASAMAHVALNRLGYPGLPPAWLETGKQFAASCIRAYGCCSSGWLAVELGRVLKVPVLISVHNVRGLAAPALVRADAIMAVSEAVAQACIATGADPARVVTVFNRVDRSVFTPDGPLADAAPAGSPRLLCVARDCEQKNIDRLLEACARLRAKHPHLALVHAGASQRDWSKWPFVKHYDSLPNDELPKWYRWSDFFVMPSLWEGFGIVLAEALACGTPCIVANRAPMNEIVQDGISGLACDPESVDSIAVALERGVSEPGLRAKLAANARSASEPYDIQRVEQREAALYRWLAAPRRPLVSVVLPTFNRVSLLEGAVRNVLAQDYENLEVIVVNDGSRDGTSDLLAKLAHEFDDRRLRVIEKANAGLPRALNTGFEAAKGEYWTWTSDDNSFRPGAISAMVRELELDPGAIMVFADFQVITPDGKPGNIVKTGPVEELPRRNVIGACFMYRAAMAREVGGYDPAAELAEDYDYWVRLARKGRLTHLARVLYDYGDAPDSLTRRRALEVSVAAGRVIASQGSRQAMHDHMVSLAGQLKAHGLPMRSLRAALWLISRHPFRKSGYWAAARALTPAAILSWRRGA